MKSSSSSSFKLASLKARTDRLEDGHVHRYEYLWMVWIYHGTSDRDRQGGTIEARPKVPTEIQERGLGTWGGGRKIWMVETNKSSMMLVQYPEMKKKIDKEPKKRKKGKALLGGGYGNEKRAKFMNEDG